MYDTTLTNRTESKIDVIFVCVDEKSGHLVYWNYSGDSAKWMHPV